MKFKHLSILIILISSVTIFSSCTYRLVDFTVISSKNHSLQFDLSQGKQVEASSVGFLGLGASIKDAMDKALQKAGQEYDLLANGVVKVHYYYIVSGYKVSGIAVSSSKLKAMLGEKGFNDWCKANNVYSPSEAIVMK